MTYIISPHGLSFMRWANHVRIDLPKVDVPVATEDTDWRDWAVDLLSNNTLYVIPYPNPKNVNAKEDPEEWKKWAEQFINCAYNLK